MRRQPVVRPHRDPTVMWVLGGTAVVVLAVVVLLWQGFGQSHKSANKGIVKLPNSAATIDGIHCDSTEQLVYHQHAKLNVYVHGKLYPVPPFVGIPMTANCLYWLHTHPGYPQGVIHMEYPTQKPSPPPTLKQFLDVWSKTRRDQDKPLATILKGGPNVHIFLNRKPYHGSVSTLKIKPHELIAIEIGNQHVKPPTFNFKKYGV